MRVIIWETEEKAKAELGFRLQIAKQEKRKIERRWDRLEKVLFSAREGDDLGDGLFQTSTNGLPLGGEGGGEEVDSFSGTSYVMKNARLIHAQLADNPPTTQASPNSNDLKDRMAADAADRLVRYGRKRYGIKEEVDRTTWPVILYGSGILKEMWDVDAGEMVDYDKETGEVKMEGDFSLSTPDIRNIFPDPEATRWEDVRYVHERFYLPWEQALSQFPDKVELLQANRVQNAQEGHGDLLSFEGGSRHDSSILNKEKYDVVELYQYWEKGLAENAFLGKFCIHTKDGELVTPLEDNPERYKPSTFAKRDRAVLPYHLLTDLDVPNQLWGQSMIEYQLHLQEQLNKIDSVMLESAQANGVPRLILPEGAELADEGLSNSPWDVTRMTGSQPPHFMEPLPIPSALITLREQSRQGVDDMAGVNEAMFGQQSRETSGFSMQYAANQGNLIRRRLMNKYTTFVENIYRRYLQILQSNWEEARTVAVVGREKINEVKQIKGADIAEGYELFVEYGSSFSVDPITRREEIMVLMPLFKEAGVPPKKLLELMRLNELDNTYNQLELSKDRQQEIFDEMVDGQIYVAPEALEDHANMLEYAYQFRMSRQFKDLSEDSKQLVEQHILEREQLFKTRQAEMQAPAGPPQPGAGPEAGGMEAGGAEAGIPIEEVSLFEV